MDIIGILYLIIRLSPLLVVSHFTLGSILNHDSKGVIYLAGLAFTCIIAYLAGNAINSNKIIVTDNSDLICKSMGLDDISAISLSQVILIFTYTYLMFIIHMIDETSYADDNMPTIILFPILIFANALWVFTNGCSTLFAILISAVIGGSGGGLWFLFIKSTGYRDLALFNGISNKAFCSKPSKTRFKCVHGKK